MDEMWYRGEAVNLAPARPGSTKAYDIGDGMYLTDRLDVATQYAKERAMEDVQAQRVYKVGVDRGSMRVLNLTTDARWKSFISTPFPSTPGRTVEDNIKQFPFEYGKTSTNFVRVYKINLNDLDATVGFEYRLGGKQICILFKNGQPSPLQAKLRGQFTPVLTGPVPASPAGALRMGGKIGPGMKIVGGGIISITLNALLRWLAGKLLEEMAREELNKQLQNLRPKIEADLKPRKESALILVGDGRQAFATVRMATVVMIDISGAEQGSTMPELEYLGLEITDRDLTKDDDGSEQKAVSSRDDSAGPALPQVVLSADLQPGRGAALPGLTEGDPVVRQRN
jgi:hypothetical protein